MSSAIDKMKGISEADRKQIEKAQEMLGPDPETMGLAKNMYWGNIREDLIFPYPESDPAETARCDEVLAKLVHYLENEHPSVQIDQEEIIPGWAIKRLFELGIMGMTIPQEYGGGGFGITSYNRALEQIGRHCGSTAVLVSAHQSIGCRALFLFGTDEQKQAWLPKLATEMVSAFCLSEPNVGSDAGGQETTLEVSEDGEYYILNGEKKWATSGCYSGMFTVMTKQKMFDKRKNKEVEKVTAVIVTPDMDGVDIFSRNRSKVGIRGTWQARIRFTNCKVPRANLLHKEGKGLALALSCLNYGRCTLSAGMLGAAKRAYEQAGKWGQTRYQFDRPLADFEMIQDYMVKMAAFTYATEAVLYLTTGMMDRNDEDIMLETALCKLFCSEIGWMVMDDATQIMGGDGQCTENELERGWRDSRINRIAEGATEVMHSFVFAYGSKQLGEHLMNVKDKAANPKFWGKGLKLGAEMFLGMKASAPHVTRLSPQLIELQTIFEELVRDFSHALKVALKDNQDKIITRQTIQRRLSWCTIWLFGMAATLGRLDRSLRRGVSGAELDYEMKVGTYYIKYANSKSREEIRGLKDNVDEVMREAIGVVRGYIDSLPSEKYAIHEKSPNAQGTGRELPQDFIKQFGSGYTSLDDLK
ncbi:MAG: acyl-CoA dehydrogenase [Planctomycetes bacterium]|nr:acyl-CoA dehydrogenase [Planctomycetota bacterium]NOG54206.1 acyl-CoA dehydrogenase [Planctomycetota bacterium]